jgi:hypothetical protein
MGDSTQGAEKMVHMPPQLRESRRQKEKEAKPEKPKTENLDTIHTA